MVRQPPVTFIIAKRKPLQSTAEQNHQVRANRNTKRSTPVNTRLVEVMIAGQGSVMVAWLVIQQTNAAPVVP
jgi:hypothetical protein